MNVEFVSIKTNYTAEKVKVKALYIRKLRHCFKKVAPHGPLSDPLLLVLEPLLAEIISVARAGQALLVTSNPNMFGFVLTYSDSDITRNPNSHLSCLCQSIAVPFFLS